MGSAGSSPEVSYTKPDWPRRIFGSAATPREIRFRGAALAEVTISLKMRRRHKGLVLLEKKGQDPKSHSGQEAAVEDCFDLLERARQGRIQPSGLCYVASPRPLASFLTACALYIGTCTLVKLTTGFTR